jgi:glutathione S-transferase
MPEETGAPCDAMAVEDGPAMKTPDFPAIDPMGRVPPLVHAGQGVAEAAAICASPAAALPEAGLAPRPAAREACLRAPSFAAAPLGQGGVNRALGLAVPPGQRGVADCGPSDPVLDTPERMGAASPFAAADRPTAADVCRGSPGGYGPAFGSPPARPARAACRPRIERRPARTRAQALGDAGFRPQGAPR